MIMRNMEIITSSCS